MNASNVVCVKVTRKSWIIQQNIVKLSYFCLKWKTVAIFYTHVCKSQCDFFPLLRDMTLILFLSFTLWNANSMPLLQNMLLSIFFKSAFKLESKSYLQIFFCKGCTHPRLNSTVEGSVGGTDYSRITLFDGESRQGILA